jgi:hypothetical protein
MLRAKPQRHRDTEKAQGQSPGVCPQIAQMTQIHRNATQRRKDAKAQRESTELDRSARSRPHCGWEPVGRNAATNTRVRSSASPHRPALSESAGLASHAEQRLAFEQARLRRDRRATRLRPWVLPEHVGASAGAKIVWDERLRSEQTIFAPGAGDHRIAGVAAAPLQVPLFTQESPLCAFASLRLCVLFRIRIWVNLGYLWTQSNASAPLRFLPSPDLRDLWAGPVRSPWRATHNLKLKTQNSNSQ